MERHPVSSFEASDLTELVTQVSRQSPDLLSTCLWLIVTNQASRRTLAEWQPSASRLLELRHQSGDTAARLIDGDPLTATQGRRYFAARAGLLPRCD